MVARGAPWAVVVLVALCAGAPLARAQLTDQQAMAVIDKVKKYVDTGQHELALDELGKANDPRTTRLMLKYMMEWTDVGLRARMVQSLTYVEAPDCMVELLKAMEDRRAPLWLKYTICDALVRKPEEHAFKELAALAGNKNLSNRLIGVNGLAMRYSDQARVVPELWKAFADDRWQVRYVAMLGLLRCRAALADAPFLDPLIKSVGRQRTDLMRGLRTLNPAVPSSLEAWQDWIRVQGDKRFEFSGDYQRFLSDQADLVRDKDNPPYVGPRAFGIKLRSQRICFIIDSCESLNTETKSPAPPGSVTPLGGVTLRKFMLEEVAQAIEGLPSDCELMVVAADRGAQPISSKLIAANDETRARLAAAVREMGTSTATNLHDAIERAFTTQGIDPLTDANFEKGPDTILLVTSGMPTAGKVAYRKIVVKEGALTWDELFLDAFDHVNRQRQIRFHCVGLGTMIPASTRLLRDLATRSGGVLVTVK